MIVQQGGCMKKLVLAGVFGFCVSFGAEAQVGWLDAAQIEAAAADGQVDICWNQAIPAGYVVVVEKTTSACVNTNNPGQPNTRTVKEPVAGGEVICSLPIPSGFVITHDKLVSGSCKPVQAVNTWNAMNIKLATESRIVVCSNSPRPAGYTSSPTSSSNPQCRTGQGFTLTKN
jgi:hypothetical protein